MIVSWLSRIRRVSLSVSQTTEHSLSLAYSASVPWRSYRMIILGSLVNVGEHPQHNLWVFRGDSIVWSSPGLWWMLGNTPSTICECSVEILSYDHPRVSGECWGTSPARSLSVPWRSYRMIIPGSLVNVGGHPQHDLWVFRGDPIVWSSSGLWWMLGDTPSTISECSVEILSYDHPRVSGECWGTPPARSLSVPWRSYRMIIPGSLVNVRESPQACSFHQHFSSSTILKKAIKKCLFRIEHAWKLTGIKKYIHVTNSTASKPQFLLCSKYGAIPTIIYGVMAFWKNVMRHFSLIGRHLESVGWTEPIFEPEPSSPMAETAEV